MMKQLGRVLRPGDRVTLPQARLTVLEMSGHRVDRIQVTDVARVGAGQDQGGSE